MWQRALSALQAEAGAHGRGLKRWRSGVTHELDEDDTTTLILGVRLPWLMSHYMWPFIFSVVFMTALLSGITIARARNAQGRRPVYFHPLAVSEAMVSITAGVLLWMGVWDLLDEYLVPEEWWAKLFMLAAGGFALFSTRTLYDETHVIDAGASNAKSNGSYSSIAPAGPGDNEKSVGPEDHSTGWCSCCSRLPEHEPATETEVEMEPPISPTTDVESGGDSIDHQAPTPWMMARPNGKERVSNMEVSSKARRYFQRPAFSPAKCGRALFAVFAGLTMWVGLWDLVDQHILPSVFTGCQLEPSGQCAMVKLGLIAVGALGLYCTRSLYGDVGRPEYSQVQFSRID